MIVAAALTDVAILTTDRLRLQPQGVQHLEGLSALLANEESRRLTGTHATFTREQVRSYLEGLAERPDRADWAIIGSQDGSYLGEVVLNELDIDNESMNLRIALAGQFGRGYGTEATRAAVAYGFDVVGLHRISLEVFAFNRQAQRVYEKCGFVREGVAREALLWNGQRHDAVLMSILATDQRTCD
ncbi:MAG: GNAT family N-acetyltransferase [Geodermatophilaceae bacterium]